MILSRWERIWCQYQAEEPGRVATGIILTCIHLMRDRRAFIFLFQFVITPGYQPTPNTPCYGLPASRLRYAERHWVHVVAFG